MPHETLGFYRRSTVQQGHSDSQHQHKTGNWAVSYITVHMVTITAINQSSFISGTRPMAHTKQWDGI